MTRPLAIDLFTGLHGWADGLVAEGFRVIGFDLEDMCGQFGQPRPEHVQLVIQDVLTLHGSQFKTAALIVASPPCQEYSYMAMPWKRAKALAAEYRSGKRDVKQLTALFDACFRIQREACAAAGRHIPLIVENVRGAIPWIGRSRWNYGSFHLWGDVPALMPSASRLREPKVPLIGGPNNYEKPNYVRRPFNGNAAQVLGQKVSGSGRSFQTASVNLQDAGLKIGGSWFHDSQSTCRKHSSKSPARKAASAMIAKIPLPLSRYIAATFVARAAA